MGRRIHPLPALSKPDREPVDWGTPHPLSPAEPYRGRLRAGSPNSEPPPSGLLDIPPRGGVHPSHRRGDGPRSIPGSPRGPEWAAPPLLPPKAGAPGDGGGRLGALPAEVLHQSADLPCLRRPLPPARLTHVLREEGGVSEGCPSGSVLNSHPLRSRFDPKRAAGGACCGGGGD